MSRFEPAVEDGVMGLTEWEIATGWVGGHLAMPHLGDFPRLPDGPDPRVGDTQCRAEDDDRPTPFAALERAVLPALLRPPCLVSFSGGMDSTFVLAVAVSAARRNGLAAPIPISWQVTDAPRADESARQAALLADLRLDDRVVLHAGDDLDFVGPVAGRLLKRYGLRYPGNLHLHLPLLEQAGGGSLLTGIGGDQVLSAWAARPTGPRRRARAALPIPIRVALARRRTRRDTWLRTTAHRTLLRELEIEASAEPTTPIDRLRWHAGSRALRMGVDDLRTVAHGCNVQVINPLLDSAFHAALGRTFAGAEPLTRAEVISAVGGLDQPPSVGERRLKARFDEVFVRRHTRSFVAGWRGTGTPAGLVDAEALRARWSSSAFPTATALLLQSVWLGAQPPDHATPPAVAPGSGEGSPARRLSFTSPIIRS